MGIDDEKRKVGERLQSLLRERSLAQSEVAGWFGLKQATVSSWCRGNSEFSITTGAELARRLGVSLDWLAGLSDERGEAPSARERAILRLAELAGALGVEGLVRLIDRAQAQAQSPAPGEPAAGSPPSRITPEQEESFWQNARRQEEAMRRMRGAEAAGPPPRGPKKRKAP